MTDIQSVIQARNHLGRMVTDRERELDRAYERIAELETAAKPIAEWLANEDDPWIGDNIADDFIRIVLEKQK